MPRHAQSQPRLREAMTLQGVWPADTLTLVTHTDFRQLVCRTLYISISVILSRCKFLLASESITSYFMKQKQNMEESISIPQVAFSGQYWLWEACMHKVPWRFVLCVCMWGGGRYRVFAILEQP